MEGLSEFLGNRSVRRRERMGGAPTDFARVVAEMRVDAEVNGRTNVVVVCLRDEEDLARGEDGWILSMLHYFVLGVDAEGWKVWMSFFDAYDLGEFMREEPFEDGFDALDEFVEDVETLVDYKVSRCAQSFVEIVTDSLGSV